MPDFLHVHRVRFAVLSFAVAVVSSAPALAQDPEASSSSVQATTLDNVVVPVPSEIFASLDKFENSNWRAVQRPEVTRWRPRFSQAQISLLLGVEIAEGFIAVEARDAKEVEEVGAVVLKLARGLGVEDTVIKRSRSIIDQARAENWPAVRAEWNDVFSDVKRGMKALKSDELPQLVSLGGWLRGTEALTVLVWQNYSPENAALLHQPALLDNFERQLDAMSRGMQKQSSVASMKEGLRKVRPFIAGEEQPSRQDVEAIRKISTDLLDRIKTRP